MLDRVPVGVQKLFKVQVHSILDNNSLLILISFFYYINHQSHHPV